MAFPFNVVCGEVGSKTGWVCVCFLLNCCWGISRVDTRCSLEDGDNMDDVETRFGDWPRTLLPTSDQFK